MSDCGTLPFRGYSCEKAGIDRLWPLPAGAPASLFCKLIHLSQHFPFLQLPLEKENQIQNITPDPGTYNYSSPRTGDVRPIVRRVQQTPQECKKRNGRS